MLRLLRTLLFIVMSIAVPTLTAAQAQNKAPPTLAPGYSDLKFAAPVPGTYRLPPLGMAGDGNVVDSQGRSKTLYQLMRNNQEAGKITLLSFIYSTCSDINGCPLAMAVFHKIKAKLTKEPKLAHQIRLLTLSFNPEHDTPERMKAYGEGSRGDGVEWQFLTPRSEQDLQQILKGYPQTIEKVYDENGKFTNTFNHQLRVYLIDNKRQFRNIYNTELLHPDTLISDIKTLLMPTAKRTEAGSNAAQAISLSTGVGDDKTGYSEKNYQTRSTAIIHHQGRPIDLLKTIKQPLLGLPPVPIPKSNPVTVDKVILGRKLFYDRRLSLNNTVSCAMCHMPEQGFTSNEMATAVGVEGRTVRRNSPTLFNVAYQQTLFHDARENTLENQVWGPLLAMNEMANPSVGYVITKIKQNPDYQGLFEKAFNKVAGMETISMAIASYERTLNAANSPFDRWYFGKDEQAMNAEAKRGFGLFIGKAGCSQCHLINKDNTLLTDHKLHNTGVGFARAMNKSADTQRVQVAPGLFENVSNEVIASVSETKANDLGRYEVTQNPKDRWFYKTPSLRNVSLTAPYLHTGEITTLQGVVEFYNSGGVANDGLDPLIKPLHLSPTEVSELTAFLTSLTGSNVEDLVSDAYAAPIGDSQ